MVPFAAYRLYALRLRAVHFTCGGAEPEQRRARPLTTRSTTPVRACAVDAARTRSLRVARAGRRTCRLHRRQLGRWQCRPKCRQTCPYVKARLAQRSVRQPRPPIPATVLLLVLTRFELRRRASFETQGRRCKPETNTRQCREKARRSRVPRHRVRVRPNPHCRLLRNRQTLEL